MTSQNSSKLFACLLTNSFSVKTWCCFSTGKRIYALILLLKSLDAAAYSISILNQQSPHGMDVANFLSVVFPSKEDENIATPR